MRPDHDLDHLLSEEQLDPVDFCHQLSQQPEYRLQYNTIQCNANRLTDQRIDGPTDRLTDRQTDK